MESATGIGDGAPKHIFGAGSFSFFWGRAEKRLLSRKCAVLLEAGNSGAAAMSSSAMQDRFAGVIKIVRFDLHCAVADDPVAHKRMQR